MSSTVLHPPAQDGRSIDRSQVAVIIPTWRAASRWRSLTAALKQQGVAGSQVLIVDSSSNDGTDSLAEAAGFRLLRIARSEFNHGATRQLAAQQVPWAKVLLYLTQDALPTPGAFDALLRAFDDPAVGAAYGRQLPRHGAYPIEAHARTFNYPANSRVYTNESRRELGLRAAFFSNSFGAYRVEALQQAGGFPNDLPMAEDTIVAARMLMLGWKTAYVAEAEVVHSHSYTTAQEFRRYFDTGVYHARSQWLLAHFGRPHNEGRRFVLSELRSLLPANFYFVPYALLRTAAKFTGYSLGLREAKLGPAWCRRLSAHPNYWNAAVRSSDSCDDKSSMSSARIQTFSYTVIKRIIDILACLLLIPLLIPVCGLIALLIRLMSSGPALFAHRRIGRGGAPFAMWKFRTMHADSEAVLQQYLNEHPEARNEWASTHKLLRDPRVTPLGRILRRYSLDELPQIWNIVRSEMSLVGPRPIVTEEVEKYAERFSCYCAVKPGVTGLWQVSGRSVLTYDERVALDCRYVNEWSLQLEARILLKTLPAAYNADSDV
jgi:rhamnosyltransferase